jgi:vitamin B12 transporter
MSKNVLVILLSLCLLATAAHAQEDDVALERIVVTPYKTGVSAKMNPSSTEVISSDEMDLRGETCITDAIKDISSLSYATSGGLQGETGVFIRGAGSMHTQMLLDGIKLSDPISTSGYFYAYNYMGLDNIERIEVLKGPYSSLYGSDSIGGTISLVTRKGEGKPKFSYLQELGSYQTLRETLASDGRINKLAYSFSVTRKDVNGFYSARYKSGNHETDPFHNLNSSLRLDYDITDAVSVSLMTDYTYAKFEYDGSTGVAPFLPADDDDNYGHFYQGVVGLNLKHKVTDNFSQKATFGLTRTYRTDWEGGGTDDWYNGMTYQVKWQGDYNICRWDKVVFGFDYLREKGEGYYASAFFTSTSPKRFSNTRGYYIENIFTPLDNLFFSASYRIEDHSVFGRDNTYSLSGSYLVKKTNTKIKGSYGKGFKAPSIYQLYDTVSGNANLNPEESKSYEGGLEQKIGKSLFLGSTFFHNQIKNMIDWVATGFWTGTYMNVSKAKIRGTEAYAEYAFNDTTSFKLSYTHLKALRTNGTRLARRPDNKLTCSLKTSVNKFTAEAQTSFVGNRIDGTNKLKSYILANLYLKYNLNKNWEFYTNFENILNYDYQLVTGYQTPQFSWYVGGKYSF